MSSEGAQAQARGCATRANCRERALISALLQGARQCLGREIDGIGVSRRRDRFDLGPPGLTTPATQSQQECQAIELADLVLSCAALTRVRQTSKGSQPAGEDGCD